METVLVSQRMIFPEVFGCRERKELQLGGKRNEANDKGHLNNKEGLLFLLLEDSLSAGLGLPFSAGAAGCVCG